MRLIILLVALIILALVNDVHVSADQSPSSTSERFLRVTTTADDEARGDFSQINLNLMKLNNRFKNSMFKKWDAYTVGHIREVLDVHPHNKRWASLLFSYLNDYKKAGGGAVKHVNNGKRVRFSNKLRARIYFD
ncbi:secreted RxLR effector peptide protein, putative [Phytophthora infestans T30-4]|uniref:RxLR effector protein n=1 Tax=Phytophthora infestans (strain T30-4) TaxID=403677 RepID=D0NAI1_PHYIT|nr:secreted RxLR effector peptide protein, putative [Phytophthora infestans T30-4]XP_002903785.1 secreted RxLR effector peptide protein, putative [Phytophthora infestans T30-4]EEY54839.1 secreted RxLR effector peptide protein, putative [Phytophthora infestans T30-4]EEY54840.1 secreted RxLR effector peptide protein, putative [Phytophthora infestans T30-4]|eukprot:XP_002903784.1 secreted RxLR effector peptide protein, putative [Phytophthora infestans T30-4]